MYWDFEHQVDSAAKVLTQWDTYNILLPLKGSSDKRTIHRHLTSSDPTSWKIIHGKMRNIAWFVDAVFAKIKTIDWVQFEVRELAKLLLDLPGWKELTNLLQPHTMDDTIMES